MNTWSIRVFGLAALTLLASCAPFRLYHQQGVPVAKMQREQLDCEISALDQAPVANQIRQSPPRYIPTRRYCDSAGNCTVRGGYFIDGEIYTVDVNAGLRQRAERQCMADRGYAFVELPRCSSAVAEKVPLGTTQVLPRLTPRSCAIRNRDGTWQIVDVVQ